MPTMELPTPTPVPGQVRDADPHLLPKHRGLRRVRWQFLRFSLVGCLNTLIDILMLNCLLWLWPTQNLSQLLFDNSLAYAVGALNSFLLNRSWTFQLGGRTNAREVARFILTTLAGIVCNDLILWCLSRALQPTQLNPMLWTNVAKVLAISGTLLVSYLSMRLWVFVHAPHERLLFSGAFPQEDGWQAGPKPAPAHAFNYQSQHIVAGLPLTTHSLSVVLPAYNEEQVIAATVEQVVRVLAVWVRDFEVIVIDDGSTDHTGSLLASMSRADARVRVVTHERNQGYGATLADGFAAATKELTFFMDSDGQFAIHDLQRFLPLIDTCDAVIGYRQQRRDTWMRKLNVWGWKQVVRLALGVRVRDIDCAFKLLRTSFLQRYPLETRGAMINAELLYKLKRADCSIREVGVRHLPRQGGRATGANLRVIGRAFRELFLSTRKWRREELYAISTSEQYLRKESTNTMIDTQNRAVVNQLASWRDQGSGLPRLWHKLALGAVMLTSIFMNFYQLGQNGFGNLFYAAGVRSMADSFHNFFFVAYDPGGFVTIDKPPLGFWLQAISVKLFGFTPFSLFLPQALAGVLAVLVLFFLVRRHFGVAAGLLAALALALSPLSVVTARNNTIDITLAFTLLLGAWAILRAAETGKWRWLLLSAALVGLGFNVKMLEAYLVVPAFGLLYLLAAPRRFRVRIGQLLVALLFLLAVSLSWAMVVDLTPASQRPYVGSSQDNSEINLAFGYNGVDRVLGRFGLGGGNHGSIGEAGKPAAKPTSSGNSNATTPGANDLSSATSVDSKSIEENLKNWGGGTDTPSPLRLFTEPIGGQISWLLPIAILGMLALLWQRRPRLQQDRQQQSLLLWGTWVLTMGTFFSISRFFHQYYMTTFAPAICALFGIGIAVMWQDYLRAGWRGWLLPLALLATAGEQIFFIASNPTWGTWLIPFIAVPCVLVALILSVARLLSQQAISSRVLIPALSFGVAALLLTPAIWSAMPGLQNTANSTPVAGPGRHFGFGGLADRMDSANTALIDYLESHQGDAKYLVATPSSMAADGIILATNQPVMAMGGFFGGDPILTTNRLASLVANGTVRFFLLNNFSFLGKSGTQAGLTNTRGATFHGGFNFFGRSMQSGLTTWVTQHCATVPASTWQATSPSSGSNGLGNATQLYDCAAGK